MMYIAILVLMRYISVLLVKREKVKGFEICFLARLMYLTYLRNAIPLFGNALQKALSEISRIYGRKKTGYFNVQLAALMARYNY